MKSAEERASEAVAFAESYEGNQLTYEQLAARLEKSFKEFARDQRQLCANVGSENASVYPIDVKRAVLNTPFPGED